MGMFLSPLWLLCLLPFMHFLFLTLSLISVFSWLPGLLISSLTWCIIWSHLQFLVAVDIHYLSQASRAGSQPGGSFVTGLCGTKNPIIRMTNKNEFQIVFNIGHELQQFSANGDWLKRIINLLTQPLIWSMNPYFGKQNMGQTWALRCLPYQGRFSGKEKYSLSSKFTIWCSCTLF